MKLDETQVMTIAKCIEDGLAHGPIADYFNVSMSTISYIRNRKSWQHVLSGNRKTCSHCNGKGYLTIATLTETRPL